MKNMSRKPLAAIRAAAAGLSLALILAAMAGCGGPAKSSWTAETSGPAVTGGAASSAAMGENAQTSGSPVATVGPSGPAVLAVYHKITPQEAKAMMGDGRPFVLVDVRTQPEYKMQHIEGAILMPYDEIPSRAAARFPDKSERIIVYCRSGNRSNVAATVLVGMGYTAVYDMGGINAWPYGTVSG